MVGAPHFDNICMAEPQAYLKMLREHRGGVRQVLFGHIHIPLSGTFPGNLPFTAGRGCTHQIVLDLEDPTVSWASGRPNYNVIMLDDDSLFVHAFDMIDAECIGTDSAPAGP